MDFQAFFERASGHPPYAFQHAFATSEQLPSLLAVPTGAGKTATAVLGWLWRRRHGPPALLADTGRRLVFCLPMRTLVEQTARACAGWLERLGLDDEVSVHVLMGGAIDRSWDDSPQREQIIIGTQDQLLSRALNRGYAMSRFRWPIQFGWLNNDCLWIIDEVQLMGAGLSTAAQLHALRRALGTHGPTHTVWMSATMQPGCLDTVDLRKHELPMLGLAADDWTRAPLAKRLQASKKLDQLPLAVDRRSDYVEKLTAEILNLHESGSLTLVVCNQVKRAQAVLAGLDKAVAKGDGPPRGLIHSRFRPRDRRELTERALSGSWSGILVATQAIEAGVDISARSLVTELAPWPSLVQRFGRCNRAGELEAGQVRWLEVPDQEALPYDPALLERARVQLRALTDVGPQSLREVDLDAVEPALPVLRRPDLLAFFDTQADLAGHDIDVSAYVRSTEADRDVQVAWRSWDEDPPPANMPDLRAEELCRVPVEQLAALLGKKGHAWRWSSLRGEWETIRDRDLVPGTTVLLPVEAGGYNPRLGWTGDKRDQPSVVELPSDAELPDFDAGDPWTHHGQRYVALATHSSDVVEALSELEAALELPELPWAELRRACRWHDLGKAHEVFRDMMVAKLDDDDPRRDGVWAKSDYVHSGRCKRRHFRHELASALALLQQGGSDLEVFLVAAHHGKVRLAIRSRPTEIGPPGQPERLFALGVYDGDTLPAVDLGDDVRSEALELDMAPMRLGRRRGEPSWSGRCLGLLDEHGPFRLAYLEALVRVADWRGTRARAARGRDG